MLGLVLQGGDQDRAALKSVTTPPLTRNKRKATEVTDSAAQDIRPAKRSVGAASPLTPLTAASTSMDSDDEFISGMSSEAEMADQDSEGSFGDGECMLSLTALRGSP